MKKILVVLLLSILLVSCGIKTNKTDKTKELSQKEKNEKVLAQKFKDITKYVKDNINDQETEELQKILEERIEIQKEISQMIKDATKDNKDEVFLLIVQKREDIMNKILPFIDDNRKQTFKEYFLKYNVAISKKLNEL